LSDSSNQPAARFAEPDGKDNVMRGFTMLAAAGAVTLTVAAAQAADLGVPFVPAPVPEFSAWYLRGNVGMTNQEVKSLSLVPLPAAFANDTITTPFLSFDSSPLFGLGVGYQLNKWLRFDGTAEYRSKAHFHGQQVDQFGASILPDDYTASKSEWLFLANAYVDLGTWWSITPFIGAGIGGSRNTIWHFMDFGASQDAGGPPCLCVLSTTYFANHSQWNFAWALYAGLSYQVTPAFNVELTYRYVDLGSAQTGTPHAFDGTVIPTSPFVFHDLTSNDLMLGMRWMLGEPAAPPPLLVRKG
jgi:opacity protein-like surface antigen